jgi:hypothetical protein
LNLGEDMRFIIKNNQVLENCINAIREIKIEDNMAVEIKPYVSKRSVDANALYWMWIAVVAEYTGYTKDEMHDVMRARYLPIKSREIDGIILTELTSTTTLNTKQFSDYMREIEVFAVENDIKLPYPEELIYSIGE